MISSLLHLVGLRPRVYYTLTNFRGGGAKAPLAPPPQYANGLKPNNNNDIIMDGTILTKVKSAKYLGVIIDHKLNWIDHIA